jgi:hypothetical protein
MTGYKLIEEGDYDNDGESLDENMVTPNFLDPIDEDEGDYEFYRDYAEDY